MDLSNLRENYRWGHLNENELSEDPLKQFDQWFKNALEEKVFEPNAMQLATVSGENKPQIRTVLLKSYDENGFSFFTNLKSSKSKDIEKNPNVSLHFVWLKLERQIRIEGTATLLPRSAAQEYFHKRPRKSQLAAWSSPQSEPIESREILEEKLKALDSKYPEQIPLPDFWGGFTVKPKRYEFWQGRENRLHDRFSYTLKNNAWNIQRLAP